MRAGERILGGIPVRDHLIGSSGSSGGRGQIRSARGSVGQGLPSLVRTASCPTDMSSIQRVDQVLLGQIDLGAVVRAGATTDGGTGN